MADEAFSALNDCLQAGSQNPTGDSNLIVKIQDMAVTDDLRKKALDQPPEWLKEKGTPQEQEQYLKTRVALEVYERFRYSPEEGLGVLVTVTPEAKEP